MLRRIACVMRRHFYETIRNPDRISDVLLWPFLDVVTWGFFSRALMRGSHAGFGVSAELVGGIVLWGAFRAFQRDIAVGFLSEIWSRNLGGLFASPLGIGEYLAGLIAINLAKLGLVLGLIALGCRVVFGLPGISLIVQLLAPIAILLVFALAIGLFVTGLILRFSVRVQSLAYGLAGVLMPFSCVLYPRAALPAGFADIAILLPTTQAFEAMRSDMEGPAAAPEMLLRGGGVALLALLAAIVFFRAVVRAARRNGRLARLF